MTWDNSNATNALKEAGQYLEKRDIEPDTKTLIGAVNRAVEEERPVNEVLEEVLSDE